MGSSFDFEIVGLADEYDAKADPILRDMYERHGAGILEIKNVDFLIFRDQWAEGEGGQREAPAHIEIQVQHQLACIGRMWGAIGVLVGGNKLELLVRLKDHEVNMAIAKKCEWFWGLLAKGEMPPVELPADADIIAKLYKYATPEKVLDLQGENAAELGPQLVSICAEYKAAAEEESEAAARKKSAKAKLLLLISDAEKVLLDGYSISATSVGEAEVAAYTRAGYRNVRITAQKPPKQGKEKSSGKGIQGRGRKPDGSGEGQGAEVGGAGSAG